VAQSASRRWTIVQLVPSLNTGGAERSTLEIARALVAAGHRSIVISGGGKWVPTLTAEGSEHHTFNCGEKSLTSVLRLPALRRLLASLKPDLLHARSRMPAWMARIVRRTLLPKPAFVTTVHGLNSVNRYSEVMTRGDRVIAVSAITLRHLAKSYPALERHRVRVIPRGVDTDQFAPETPTDDWCDAFFADYPQLRGRRLLVLPGRGTRLKGHVDAIGLLGALHERGIDAALLLLGVIDADRGHYVQELRDVAVASGVDDRVVFAPARDDMRQIYALSDAVLQLSHRPESFGRTVTEALQMDRPVIGYDHGGVGELLRTIFPAGLVPLGDAESLANVTEIVLREAHPIDRSAIPTLSQMQRLTLSVYAELIDGAPPDPSFA
jgi:glycosyltransferase involved in cell wall biosynthesis